MAASYARRAMPIHVCLVEDDPDTRELLTELLQQQGWQVSGHARAEALLAQWRTARPDLLLLDVALPGMSGLEACRRLRAAGEQLPVLLMTALDSEAERVLALELGADDHLAKPFSSRELLARIRVQLRRLAQPRPLVEGLHLGPWRLDPGTRSLHDARGERLALSELEFVLMSELARRPGQVLGREQLLSGLRGVLPRPQPRSIDMAVLRLRRRLESDPARPRWIQTVRGQGYRYQP